VTNAEIDERARRIAQILNEAVGREVILAALERLRDLPEGQDVQKAFINAVETIMVERTPRGLARRSLPRRGAY
jgi:hypothetical protein